MDSERGGNGAVSDGDGSTCAGKDGDRDAKGISTDIDSNSVG